MTEKLGYEGEHLRVHIFSRQVLFVILDISLHLMLFIYKTNKFVL